MMAAGRRPVASLMAAGRRPVASLKKVAARAPATALVKGVWGRRAVCEVVSVRGVDRGRGVLGAADSA
jgi:hypothetical protein